MTSAETTFLISLFLFITACALMADITRIWRFVRARARFLSEPAHLGDHINVLVAIAVLSSIAGGLIR
jgi:hypothetical protein